jgi:hypothetical protein
MEIGGVHGLLGSWVGGLGDLEPGSSLYLVQTSEGRTWNPCMDVVRQRDGLKSKVFDPKPLI